MASGSQGRVQGKVALITGAARGQGRSHAVRLAQEGADIIAIDICKQIDTVPYPMSGPDDLAETVRQVEELDRRIVAAEADVRNLDGLTTIVADAVGQLGRLDIVCANAGIAGFGTVEQLTGDAWRNMIDVNLTGVWNTAKAAIPHLIAGGRGGSIVLTSSAAGLIAWQNIGHYVAAKHGVVGVMRNLALELAPHMIRVNTVHPTQVNSPMLMNQASFDLFVPDKPNPTADDAAPVSQGMNVLPIPWVEPVDISNAILFLSSDEGRYITGVCLPVDAGAVIKGAA